MRSSHKLDANPNLGLWWFSLVSLSKEIKKNYTSLVIILMGGVHTQYWFSFSLLRILCCFISHVKSCFIFSWKWLLFFCVVKLIFVGVAGSDIHNCCGDNNNCYYLVISLSTNLYIYIESISQGQEKKIVSNIISFNVRKARLIHG